MLTPEVRDVLSGLIPLLGRCAREKGVSIKEIGVRGIPTSDEAWEQLIVAVQVGLPLDEAFAFWGELSDAVQEWTHTLPAAQANVLLDLIGLEVWEEEGNAPV